MLHVATLLRIPKSTALTEVESVWREVVRPFLESKGYTSELYRIIERGDAQESADDRPMLALNIHASPSAQEEDMVLVVDVDSPSPGEVLERAFSQLSDHPSPPPLLALIHRQRGGLVLSVFHTDTRRPWGMPFPGPELLGNLAAGLRRAATMRHALTRDPADLSNAVVAARRRGDPILLSDLLQKLAEGYLERGRYHEGRAALLERLALLKASQGQSEGHDEEKARVSRHLGQVCSILEEWEEAESHLLNALDYHRERRNPRVIAAILVELGAVHAACRRNDVAAALYDEALEYSSDTGDTATTAAALNNYAQLLIDIGELDQAIQRMELSLELTKRQGDPREELITLYNLAVIYDRMGESQQARRLIHAVKELSDVLDARLR